MAIISVRYSSFGTSGHCKPAAVISPLQKCDLVVRARPMGSVIVILPNSVEVFVSLLLGLGPMHQLFFCRHAV